MTCLNASFPIDFKLHVPFLPAALAGTSFGSKRNKMDSVQLIKSY